MKRKILYTLLGCTGMFLAACNDDDIKPSIDISPEYESVLELTPNSIHADTLIKGWYDEYGCAVLYKFEKKDFGWLWTDQLNYYYELCDVTKQEDSVAVENMVRYIGNLIASKDEEELVSTLPYKIFLTKELHDGDEKSDDYVNLLYNGQNAIMLGYLSSETESFDEATFGTNLNATYTTLIYNALTPKPTEFIASRETCGNTGLIILPDNDAVESEPEWEPEVYPDFIPRDDTGEVSTYDTYYHKANVLGYITSYGASPGTAPMYIPDEAQDYADYLSFITGQPGSYIRPRTQYYWRIAKRATLLIEYYREYQGEDLIATQNANFPDDPVTMEDFAYEERY